MDKNVLIVINSQERLLSTVSRELSTVFQKKMIEINRGPINFPSGTLP